MRNNRYRASIPSHNSSHQTVSSIEPILRSQTTSIFTAPFRNALKANWEKCKIAQYLGGASSIERHIGIEKTTQVVTKSMKEGFEELWSFGAPGS